MIKNKINSKKSLHLIVFVAIIFLLATGLSSCGGVTVIESIATETQVVIPTNTITASPIPSATHTPLPSATVTPSPSPTPKPIIITIKQSSFCRQGPGTLYPIIDFLEAGYQTEAIGKGDLGPQFFGQIWFVIIGPASGENCWVFGDLVALSTDGEGLALLVAPATRTPEPLPTINPNGLIYYLILLDTGGPFACGDSLIAVNSGIKKTGDTGKDIILALNALFNLKTEYIGALYNALYQSSLKAKSVDISGSDATVYTRGTVVKPKEDCDKERFRLQVFTTVRNFSGINSTTIYANNVFLGDLLEQGYK